MHTRIKRSTVVALIITLIITGAVAMISLLSGKSELYDIGVNLLTTGIVITALVIPLFYRSHHRARTRIHLHLSVEDRNRTVSDTYYDYFAGVAFAPIATAILGFLLVTLASFLGQRSATKATILFVGSARPGVIEMQEIARQHYKDAYLTELKYNFGRIKDNILITEFESPNNPYWFLIIKLAADGEYIEKPYDLSSPLSPPIPIGDEDWPIDSKEAISIFSQDDRLKACIALPQDREELLELTRSYSTNSTEVKWCLIIEGCEETQTRNCINASTGEKIILND